MKESLDSVGFTYFLVMARIHDIDPRLAFSEGKSRVSHALHPAIQRSVCMFACDTYTSATRMCSTCITDCITEHTIIHVVPLMRSVHTILVCCNSYHAVSIKFMRLAFITILNAVRVQC